MKKLVCFHLYNDYSGSPKVLRMVLSGLLSRGYQIDLVTSEGGVLDELEGENLRRHSYHYQFSANPLLTFFRYTWIQIYTFFLAFRYIGDKNVIFYINTLLPAGPALAGRMMGKKVIYHYHENAFAKGAFYKILSWFMQRLAHKIICVSEYQASFLKKQTKVCVIPNALSDELTQKLNSDPEEAFKRQTVLMLSSLKEYKGTREFIRLAARLPQFRFVLVVNDTQENIDAYISDMPVTDNLSIYPRQKDVSRFYNLSSMVLNLTNPDLAVETFGLTTLEAMAAGLPVIVPEVGGIAELVENGSNGYKIDVRRLNLITDKITEVLSDHDLYCRLSEKAFSKSRNFSENLMLMHMDQFISCIFAGN